MAANKFATFLHKHTSKITVILVYAVLEWILIFLLLLNSFFTYLITKFANYFGLKPPCPWCSRVDHVLEPAENSTSSYRDMVCDRHATEISKLSYCSSHGRLAESHLMCESCLASQPNPGENKSIGMTRRIAFISWVRGDQKVENGEKVVSCCSCCKGKLHPPYFLFKPTWGGLDYAQKGSLIVEDDSESEQYKESSKPDSQANQESEDMIEIRLNTEEDYSENDEGAKAEHLMLSDVGSSGLGETLEEEWSRPLQDISCHDKEVHEDEISGRVDIIEQHFSGTSKVHQSSDHDNVVGFEEDNMLEFINLQPQKCVSNRLFPVELVDLSTFADQFSEKQDLGKQDDENETNDSLIADTALQREVENSLLVDAADKGKEDLVDEATEQVISQHEAIDGNYTESPSTQNLDNISDDQLEENDLNLLVDQPKPDILLGTQESDLYRVEESVPSVQCLEEYRSSSINNEAEEVNPPESYSNNDAGTNQREKTTTENKMVSSSDDNQEGMNTCFSLRLDAGEAEVEKFPETPTSLEGMHYLHKKLLLLEKRESGQEESLDGSTVSEMESGDPIQTIERLKTSLKAERKALNALYAELEEERSASAIAANQTMAMITRLQEEKAAMQMEALQYQRMMEEQSEYDQEALQLLNELMIKREKEKQELEKELEVYRKKILDYEVKEKVRMMSRSKDGSVKSRKSSATGSYVEDSDELSIDLNREAKDEDTSISDQQESSSYNTPAGAVLNLEEMALDCVNHMNALDESLTEFEEERLSILDQLKTLEDKLITMGDDQFMEDLKSIQNPFEENGLSSEFAKDRSYVEGKTMASMARTLLPFLDATENETEEELIYQKQEECEPIEMQNYPDMDGKKHVIEEVDRVYERLQALEEDKEFLKNCIGSVKRGDKGMDLLQEILQHLRDLKAVELRTTTMTAESLCTMHFQASAEVFCRLRWSDYSFPSIKSSMESISFSCKDGISPDGWRDSLTCFS